MSLSWGGRAFRPGNSLLTMCAVLWVSSAEAWAAEAAPTKSAREAGFMESDPIGTK
jgi:hypothetical protein